MWNEIHGRSFIHESQLAVIPFVCEMTFQKGKKASALDAIVTILVDLVPNAILFLSKQQSDCIQQKTV